MSEWERREQVALSALNATVSASQPVVGSIRLGGLLSCVCLQRVDPPRRGFDPLLHSTSVRATSSFYSTARQ